MKIGDLVLYQGQRWKLESHNRDFRTSIIVNFEGGKLEIPDDLDQSDTLTVLCNPSESWPFTTVPVKVKAGPLRRVTRGSVGLRPMADWVPSDFLRPGGAIFFNPVLHLRTGEVLVATHQDGTLSRVTINKSFGTVNRKVARARKSVPKGPLSAYERLLADDFFKELK